MKYVRFLLGEWKNDIHNDVYKFFNINSLPKPELGLGFDGNHPFFSIDVPEPHIQEFYLSFYSDLYVNSFSLIVSENSYENIITLLIYITLIILV